MTKFGPIPIPAESVPPFPQSASRSATVRRRPERQAIPHTVNRGLSGKTVLNARLHAESFSPLAFYNGDDRTHLRSGGVEFAGGVHHKVRVSALLGIRHLSSQNRVELLGGHAWSRSHAAPLHLGWSGDHNHGVNALLAAGRSGISSTAGFSLRDCASAMSLRSAQEQADAQLPPAFSEAADFCGRKGCAGVSHCSWKIGEVHVHHWSHRLTWHGQIDLRTLFCRARNAGARCRCGQKEVLARMVRALQPVGASPPHVARRTTGSDGHSLYQASPFGCLQVRRIHFSFPLFPVVPSSIFDRP